MTETAEVAVAGGGPAGAAFACLSALRGRDTILVEREAGPRDKVCGDFLSGEAAIYLRALDLSPARIGAVPIRRVRLAAGRRTAEAMLPFEAWSLRRRVLDELILARAGDAGVRLHRGVRIEALERGAAGRGGWTLRRAGAPAVSAPVVALATGKHDLRGWKRGKGRQNDLIGFKWYWRLAPDARAALGDAVELVLFPGGYAGLLPVEDGTANLCLVISHDRLAAIGGTPAAVLDLVRTSSPILRARLDGADPASDAALAVASLPYGYVHRAPSPPGIVRLGDQAAVIPSLAGDGISLALHAAFHHACGSDASALVAGLAAPVRRATRLSGLLVQPRWQSAAVAAARLCPPLLHAASRLTRLAPDALVA